MTTTRWIAIASMIAFPILPSCYSDLKRRNEDLANQNHQLESELNQARAERDEAHSREEMLNRQVAAIREEERASRDASAARSTQANWSSEPTKTTEAVKPAEKKSTQQATALAKKLSTGLAGTKATVSTRDGRICILLPLGTSFSPGSADLDTQGKRLVHDVGKVLFRELPKDQRMFVVGHTDSDPPKKSKAKFPDNNALSYARAQAVASELKAIGIDSKRMVPSGAGESSPIAAGTGAKEKEKNRRVEIWID